MAQDGRTACCLYIFLLQVTRGSLQRCTVAITSRERLQYLVALLIRGPPFLEPDCSCRLPDFVGLLSKDMSCNFLYFLLVTLSAHY